MVTQVWPINTEYSAYDGCWRKAVGRVMTSMERPLLAKRSFA